MENQIKAAKGSRRRGVKPPAVGSVSETRLSGNDLDGINGLPINSAETGEQIASAVCRQESAIQPVPHLAWSYEQAAERLGTKLGAIKYLVRTNQLLAVPLCGQKSLVIYEEDLVQFARKRRDAFVTKVKHTATCVGQ